MNITRVTDCLYGWHIPFEPILHSRAFTAQTTAACAAVPGHEMAKTVMVKVDGKMTMAVLPAPYQVDLHLLKKFIGAHEVDLADEDEFADIFPDCEIGAMPPFGNLYGIEVYVDVHLSMDEYIVFHAGCLTELIKIRYKDYDKIVRPVVAAFSVAQKRHAA